MNNEKAIKAKLESYCEWCIAQGGDCHAKLDGCGIFEALALLREPEKPCGWIPVSERLPDEGECLVLCEGHIYEVKVRVSEDEWEDKEGKTFLEQTARCDIWHLGTIIIGHDECITHWMPIVLPTEKPTCSMCGENPRGIPAKDGGWTTCPKCLPKENMAEFDPIRLRKHLLLERARITKCLKREEKLHTDFQKRYKREEYSGWIKDISIPEFSKQLYWVNESIKALDKVESQERNATASEILIGDLTKKIEGMEAEQ